LVMIMDILGAAAGRERPRPCLAICRKLLLMVLDCNLFFLLMKR